MTKRRVTVLGGGNGARATAAEIGIAGHQVTLCEFPGHGASLDDIEAAGKLRSTGVISGDTQVRLTHDLADALEGADIVFIVAPTMYQGAWADALAPFLYDGMNIVLVPGSLGSLEFVARVQALREMPAITVSEMAALPYAVRITGPAQVHVFGRRKYVSVGTFPARASGRVMEIVDDVYPGARRHVDVLEAGLNNPNPTLHCLGVLLSASRIEYSHGEFYYYEEGMTPRVCAAIEVIDAERVAIGEALGVEVMSLIDTYPTMGYGPRGDTFWSVIRGVSPLHGIKGPDSVESRYLTEDVPIGLTIYSRLGRQIGVATPVMESVITLSSALLGRDFAAGGRTPEVCGIDGMTVAQLRHYAATGSRP